MADAEMASNNDGYAAFGANDEEDDEVVAEFDICLAGNLKDYLQLLQYPLRPNNRQYGDQGDLSEVHVAVESRQKSDEAQ